MSSTDGLEEAKAISNLNEATRAFAGREKWRVVHVGCVPGLKGELLTILAVSGIIESLSGLLSGMGLVERVTSTSSAPDRTPASERASETI